MRITLARARRLFSLRSFYNALLGCISRPILMRSTANVFGQRRGASTVATLIQHFIGMVTAVCNRSRYGMHGRLAHLLGVLLLTGSITSEATERERIAKCEADWSRVSGATASGGPPVDKSGMLKSWLALESACRGTGLFEYRLASLYVAVDQPSNAIPLLVNVESWPGDYAKVAPFLRLNAQMKIYLAQTPFPRDQFNALKPQFLAALALAPDTAVANEQTSHYLMMIGDYADATKYATCVRITQSITLPPASHPKQCHRFVFGETMQLGVSSPSCQGHRHARSFPWLVRVSPCASISLARLTSRFSRSSSSSGIRAIRASRTRGWQKPVKTPGHKITRMHATPLWRIVNGILQ